MLRFDTQPRRQPPGLLSRGLQLRLLLLVVGLGIVLAARGHLQTPEGAAAIARLMRGGGIDQAGSAGTEDKLPPPLIAADQLAPIRDNTFFRREESAAWFALLAELQRADPADADALGPVAYAQLVRQPHRYRGRLVRVAGTLRRAEIVPAGENDLGVESLYRLILQGQGGEAWPTTLYSLTPPAGGALNKPIRIPVEATGVFFKNWSYRWRDGLGVSPVFLTRGVAVLADPLQLEAAADPPDEPPPAWLTPIALTIAAGVLIVIWRRAHRPRQTALGRPGRTPDFTSLEPPQSAE